MYPFVEQWLNAFLKERYPQRQASTLICNSQKLNAVVRRLGLTSLLPGEWQSWDVKVDIVGFAHDDRSIAIALVECKIKPVSLQYLSQIIGYSRVVKPDLSLILSPQGVSDPLKKLILNFGREDILEYGDKHHQGPRKIVIARWDTNTNTPDYGSLIPAGSV